MISSYYTQVQVDARIAELKKQYLSNITDYLGIEDPAPTEVGKYELTSIGSYINLVPAIYPNTTTVTSTPYTTKANYINTVFFDGTNFIFNEVALPANPSEVPQWVAGTYQVGASVYNNETTWRANKTTTQEPKEGSSDWEVMVGIVDEVFDQNSENAISNKAVFPLKNVLYYFLSIPTVDPYVLDTYTYNTGILNSNGTVETNSILLSDGGIFSLTGAKIWRNILLKKDAKVYSKIKITFNRFGDREMQPNHCNLLKKDINGVITPLIVGVPSSPPETLEFDISDAYSISFSTGGSTSAQTNFKVEMIGNTLSELKGNINAVKDYVDSKTENISLNRVWTDYTDMFIMGFTWDGDIKPYTTSSARYFSRAVLVKKGDIVKSIGFSGTIDLSLRVFRTDGTATVNMYSDNFEYKIDDPTIIAVEFGYKGTSGKFQMYQAPNYGNTINTIDWGVIPNTSTDYSLQLTTLVKVLQAAGGGILNFANGVYNARIEIQHISTPRHCFITIQGTQNPNHKFGTVPFPAAPWTPSSGVVIQSKTSTDYVIGTPEASSNDFNRTGIHLKNITIRTDGNPKAHGAYLKYCREVIVEDVIIDTGIYSANCPEPTNGKSGLIMPYVDNGALSLIKNVDISGYYNGLECGEHTEGWGINVTCNYVGILFPKQHGLHMTHLSRVCAQRNRTQVKVEGACRFIIAALNMEYPQSNQMDSVTQWQDCLYELDDAGNLGSGNITYANLKGNGGGSKSTFRMNGANNIIVKRVGEEARVTVTIPD